MTLIYKLLSQKEWMGALGRGYFEGSAVDHVDGYIHFSTAGQLPETAAKHFHGRDDLVALEVDAEVLGDALRWEPSRGGDLFPHLYADLPVTAVKRALLVELGADGAPRVEL